MVTNNDKMEVGNGGTEVTADEGLCYGQEILGSGFQAPAFLEGSRAPTAPSLPVSSPGPAEGDPPPFAAPQLSPGAFRPLNNTSSSSSSSSPASFLVQNLFREADSERLTPSSDLSSSSVDRLTPDEASQRTLRKRRAGGGLLCSLGGSNAVPGHCTCPVCGVTVRPHELQTHFQQEASLLAKIPKQVGRHAKDLQSSSSQTRRSTSPSSSSGPSSSTAASGRRDSAEPRSTPTSRTEIFERVRSNRNCRLSSRTGRSGPTDSCEDCSEAQCPVCHKHLQGTASQLNRHAEACLRKRGMDPGSSEDEDVDIEGEPGVSGAMGDEDEEDEYRWAGQTRVRVTSLLRGNFEACGYTTVRPSAEDDEDLNVDGDDTATYGQPQYTESDVIPCGSSKTSREDEALRRAISSTRNEVSEEESLPSQNDADQNEERRNSSTSSTEAIIHNGEVNEEGGEEGNRLESNEYQADDNVSPEQNADRQSLVSLHSSGGNGTLQTRACDQRLLIAALHQQIADLRGKDCQSGQGVLKCLVCMDPYNRPVVSVGCWHVYCEECWLRTLGAKKLCPQCNTITSASDLRKIYI